MYTLWLNTLRDFILRDFKVTLPRVKFNNLVFRIIEKLITL